MKPSVMEFWWLTRLREGVLLDEDDRWLQAPQGELWPQYVCSPTLHSTMARVLSEGHRIVPTTTAFALALNKMTMTTLRRVTTRWNGPTGHRTSSAIVNLPSLTECRGAFEAYMNKSFDWPDDPSFKHRPGFMDTTIPPEWLK